MNNEQERPSALDTGYFGRKLAIITRDLSQYTPQEMARELVRLAKVADASEASNEFLATTAAPERSGKLAAQDHDVILASRLLEAVETICGQSGEEVGRMVDWLTNESGMFKCLSAYYLKPSPAPEADSSSAAPSDEREGVVWRFDPKSGGNTAAARKASERIDAMHKSVVGVFAAIKEGSASAASSELLEEARREGWGQGMQEAQELLAGEIEDAGRFQVLSDACRALIDYCDKNPPMAGSLWCVQQIRAALAAPAPTGESLNAVREAALKEAIDVIEEKRLAVVNDPAQRNGLFDARCYVQALLATPRQTEDGGLSAAIAGLRGKDSADKYLDYTVEMIVAHRDGWGAALRAVERLAPKEPATQGGVPGGALHDSLTRCCEDLPEGYGIVVNAERGSGSVTWVSPDGDEFDIEGEGHLSDDVTEAYNACWSHASLGGSDLAAPTGDHP